MIDYKKIADGDPGGELTAAFDAMLAETAILSTDKMASYVTIAREAGFTVAAALEQRVNELIASNVLPSWVREALVANGLNVNDPQVEATLETMVGSTLTTDHVNAILAMKNVVTPVYPGLRAGHLQNARQKRQRGDI